MIAEDLLSRLVDAEAIESLRRRSQFNVIDYATGWKVDFIIPPFEDFISKSLSDGR